MAQGKGEDVTPRPNTTANTWKGWRMQNELTPECNAQASEKLGPNDSAPDILDDFFHLCAFQAYLTVACEFGNPPPSERVKELAYRLYEAELKRKNAAKSVEQPKEKV